ncbi:hypothetical protein [Hydrocoleum sp. CS-953]|uniref:hypothetical protein n=1 Tax=Hydrocoleum sp. CS-953 TaxID=1671698 RepID=UPI0026D2B965
MTIGTIWQFLKLDGDIFSIDLREYSVSQAYEVHLSLISCPVASVLYRQGKEEGTRKKKEGFSYLGEKEEKKEKP